MTDQSTSPFSYEYLVDEGLVTIFANGHKIIEISDDDGNPEQVLNWFVNNYSKTNLALNYTGYVEWKAPDSIPEVEKGTQRLLWLAVEVSRPNPHPNTEQTKVITLLAIYQNRPLDLDKEGESLDDDCLVDTDGAPLGSVGWVFDKQHYEFDNYYVPIEFNDNYKMLGWAEYTPPAFTAPMESNKNG